MFILSARGKQPIYLVTTLEISTNNFMRIIITGVAGFIGSNLGQRLIAAKHKVIGVDNLAYGVKSQIPKGIKFRKVDIRSQAIYPLLRGTDVVFHLAAKNTIVDCQKDPVETADINITGTVNVYEASRRAKAKRIVYAETAALYDGIKKMPVSEDTIAPEGFYALSKVADNMFANAYYRWSGLPVVGLRYFNVYGPRQDYRRTIPPVMSAFIIKLLRGKRPFIYGSGKQRRDFIYVDDINDFHLQCLKDDRVIGQVFNLGSGKSYSVLEIYDKIQKILKTNIKPIFKPALEGDEVMDSIADISRAKKLGWRPKTDIDAGLRQMIDYIKKEIQKGNIK